MRGIGSVVVCGAAVRDPVVSPGRFAAARRWCCGGWRYACEVWYTFADVWQQGVPRAVALSWGVGCSPAAWSRHLCALGWPASRSSASESANRAAHRRLPSRLNEARRCELRSSFAKVGERQPCVVTAATTSRALSFATALAYYAFFSRFRRGGTASGACSCAPTG